MRSNITVFESYKAVYEYLKNYFYNNNKPDEIRFLLSNMILLEDNTSSDPAMFSDWMDALKEILVEVDENNEISIRDGYLSMHIFLKKFYARGKQLHEYEERFGSHSLKKKNYPANPDIWRDWEDAVKRISAEGYNTIYSDSKGKSSAYQEKLLSALEKILISKGIFKDDAEIDGI